jgi:hypothetical protein
MIDELAFRTLIAANAWPTWIRTLPKPARKRMGLQAPRALAKSRAQFRGQPVRLISTKDNRYWYASITNL